MLTERRSMVMSSLLKKLDDVKMWSAFIDSPLPDSFDSEAQ
jgi:hypothetical protein